MPEDPRVVQTRQRLSIANLSKLNRKTANILSRANGATQVKKNETGPNDPVVW